MDVRENNFFLINISRNIYFLENDLPLLEKFVNQDYVIQIDAGSIIGHFGKQVQDCANKIILNGLFHLIGSDAHNDKKRNFCLGNLFKIQNAVINNYKKLIFNHNPQKIIDGDSISAVKEYFDDDKFTLWRGILHKFTGKFLRRIYKK